MRFSVRRLLILEALGYCQVLIFLQVVMHAHPTFHISQLKPVHGQIPLPTSSIGDFTIPYSDLVQENG